MLTVAWDVDDVLNDLMQAWFSEAWLPSHRDCKLSYSEITENPPDRVVGIERAEYLASLDRFRVSAGADNLKPNPKLLQWFEDFGPEYRHMALTVRPLDSVPQTAEWIFRHFGKYIRSFSVVPSRAPAGVPIYDRSKAEFLEWLGKADILVDDSEENIREAAKLGIHGVLYPQPWNKSSLTVSQALESISMPPRTEHSFSRHRTEAV